MARKNPFANLMEGTPTQEGLPALDYTVKGASRSILNSIDEMAARADKLLEGETIVDLDPALLEPSFVRDRIDEDPAEYAELLAAIRDRGQDSPILVRPHPKLSGRYMIVFGHRRARIAQELGRPVRAVVKDMKDQSHVIAQGQENSVRANLSFIEKASFADRLVKLNYDGDNATAMAALSIDRSTLSKMLAVAALPQPVRDAVGAAKGIGRDRWYELKMLLEKPQNLSRATEFIAGHDFAGRSGDDRFNALFSHLKAGKKVANGPKNTRKWAPPSKGVAVSISTDGRSFTLALKAKEAVGFGEFISANLEELYDAYRKQVDDKAGD